MKKRIKVLFLVLPLLTSFTSGFVDNSLKLRNFTIYPLQIEKVSRILFVFETNNVFPKNLSVTLKLSNRIYVDKIIKSQTTQLTLTSPTRFEIDVPPWYLNIGLNYFNLEANYGSTSKELNLKIGANHRQQVTLPSSDILLNSYVGATFEQGHLYEKVFFPSIDSYTNEHNILNDLYFDLGTLTTSYDADELRYHSARLIFNGMKNLFPKLSLTTEGSPYLDLIIFQKDGILTFGLLMPLFVDDETHIISPIKETGFRLTSFIFFPKYFHEDIEFHSLTLEINGFSQIKTDIRYTFSLSIDKDFLGQSGTYGLIYESGNI